DKCKKQFYTEKYGLTDEEWEDYKNIQNCLGEFYGLLPQLKITNPKEQIKLCKSNELGSVRECKNCNVDQKSIVNLDHDRAREMLKCAADKLYNYDGNLPDEVKTALENHFSGISKEILADFLSFMCKYVRFNSADCNYINQLNGTGYCGEFTTAWTYPATHLADVRLCDPEYWSLSNIDRSSTLIHEWFHNYFVAGDWQYEWSSKYKDLKLYQALTNADSFSNLVKDLCK
ncbi:MAG TPA: M35 family metallo-endopeptidase, partial [Saprospiraceae bacterium]|nr:M35 family metallo-endopeptidase [Saprospiraceae bacterium]